MDFCAAFWSQTSEGHCRYANSCEGRGVGWVHVNFSGDREAFYFAHEVDVFCNNFVTGANCGFVTDENAGHINVDVEQVFVHFIFMVFAVCFGTAQTDFFRTAPYEFQSSLWWVFDEVVHDFHNGDGAGAIVPCAGAVDYGVEVSGECDDFFRFFGTFDGSNYVMGSTFFVAILFQNEGDFFYAHVQQFSSVGHMDYNAWEVSIFAWFSAFVSGTDLWDHFFWIVDGTVASNVAESAGFSHSFQNFWFSHTGQQQDFTFCIDHVSFQTVFNVQQRTGNTFVRGNAGFADTYAANFASFWFVNSQFSFVDFRHIDFECFDNSRNANFFAFCFQQFSSFQFAWGTSDTSEAQSFQYFECSVFANVHGKNISLKRQCRKFINLCSKITYFSVL